MRTETQERSSKTPITFVIPILLLTMVLVLPGCCLFGGHAPPAVYKLVKIKEPTFCTVITVRKCFLIAPVAACPTSDRVVAAAVTDRGTSFDVHALFIDGPVPTDSLVSQSHQDLLEAALLAGGLYDPASQSITYFQTTEAVDLTRVQCAGIEYLLNGGEEITEGTVTIMLALEDDLDTGMIVPAILIDDLTTSLPPFTQCAEPITQLHIIANTPGALVVGREASITASVQAKFVGAAGIHVLFTALEGDVTFTTDAILPEGTMSIVETDAEGIATTTFIANTTDPVLIEVALSFSEFRTYAFFQVSGPCPWDLDNNGSVGATDLLSLLVQWGTDPGGPPDFDGNGSVGVSDLLALLANWGPCP